LDSNRKLELWIINLTCSIAHAIEIFFRWLYLALVNTLDGNKNDHFAAIMTDPLIGLIQQKCQRIKALSTSSTVLVHFLGLQSLEHLFSTSQSASLASVIVSDTMFSNLKQLIQFELGPRTGAAHDNTIHRQVCGRCIFGLHCRVSHLLSAMMRIRQDMKVRSTPLFVCLFGCLFVYLFVCLFAN
jgi:hypothetical protein